MLTTRATGLWSGLIAILVLAGSDSPATGRSEEGALVGAPSSPRAGGPGRGRSRRRARRAGALVRPAPHPPPRPDPADSARDRAAHGTCRRSRDCGARSLGDRGAHRPALGRRSRGRDPGPSTGTPALGPVLVIEAAPPDPTTKPRSPDRPGAGGSGRCTGIPERVRRPGSRSARARSRRRRGRASIPATWRKC